MIEAIADNPGAKTSALGKLTQSNPTSVVERLRRLQERGRIERTEIGWKVVEREEDGPRPPKPLPTAAAAPKTQATASPA